MLRNWIEKKIGKRWAFPPVMVGRKGSREIYCINWEDGTMQDYFIDWEAEEIEAAFPGIVRGSSYPYEIIKGE